MLLVLMVSGLSVAAQEVKVTTDRQSCPVGDIVSVTFEVNVKYDSMVLPEFKDFEVMGKPAMSSSVTVQQGEMIRRESRTYKLRPVRAGRLKIDSPVYYISGKKFEGKAVRIKAQSRQSK